MDFIERFFSMSPDHGDGTTELLCVFILVFVLIAAGSKHEIVKIFRMFKHSDERVATVAAKAI
jgi:hypothetical protein